MGGSSAMTGAPPAASKSPPGARAPGPRGDRRVHLQCLAPATPPEQLPLAHCMFRLHGAPAGSLRIGRCGPLRHTPSLQFREAHCRSNSQCAPTGSLARLDVASSMIRVPPSMRRCSIAPPVSPLTRLVAGCAPVPPGTRRCSMVLPFSRCIGLLSRLGSRGARRSPRDVCDSYPRHHSISLHFAGRFTCSAWRQPGPSTCRSRIGCSVCTERPSGASASCASDCRGTPHAGKSPRRIAGWTNSARRTAPSPCSAWPAARSDLLPE